MIDALRVFEELSKSLDEKTARFLSETLAHMYEELSEGLTKSDLRDFEARFDARLAEIAEIGARTDARLASLAERVEELAEAQGRTEVRVQELAEAQRATEEHLQRLEEKFERMVDEFADLRRQVGGLSDAVGYGLENSVFPYLRSFAKQEFGIDLRIFDRRNIEYPDGRFDEINIYAEGRRNDEEVILLGEAKSQPSKRDVDAFARRADRVGGYLKRPVFSFFVGHSFSPEVERHLAEHHPRIKPLKSFVFEVSYVREVPGSAAGAHKAE